MNKLIVFILISLTGCANIRQPMDNSHDIDPNKAYLIGGFLNSYRESYIRMVIEVVCEEPDNSIFIELDQPENAAPIEIYPIVPGECQIKNFVPIGGIGDYDKKYLLDDTDYFNSFLTEKGNLYYIGHFEGTSTNDIQTFTVEREYQINQTLISDAELSNLISNYYPGFKDVIPVRVFRLNK